MSALRRPVRPSAARLAGAMLAVSLLVAGCGEGTSEPEHPSESPTASDSSTASDEGGASDDGGRTAAAVPQEAYAVTPAPEGFTPPASCSGEGAYLAEVGGTATPALPERAGETLTITAEGIDGDHAQLTATLGDGEPRPIEDMTLGETATVDLWTLSVTSVCEDSGQVEFDVID